MHHHPHAPRRRLAKALALAFLATFGLTTSSSFAEPAKSSREHIAAATTRVDEKAVRANTATSRDWPTYGLDYAETRHSKLTEINAGNVKQLGLAWSYNLESTRGVEATPLMVDGIMYVSASWKIGRAHV